MKLRSKRRIRKLIKDIRDEKWKSDLVEHIEQGEGVSRVEQIVGSREEAIKIIQELSSK